MGSFLKVRYESKGRGGLKRKKRIGTERLYWMNRNVSIGTDIKWKGKIRLKE